jgi:hypothetical protein
MRISARKPMRIERKPNTKRRTLNKGRGVKMKETSLKSFK